MSQPKVLITGSNGLLGQELRKVFSQNNFFVIATGIGADRSKYQSNVYVEMDVTSSEQCKSVLYKYMPSVIINAAAMTNVDNCERNQKKCCEVNLNSANNLLPYLKEHQPHFIQISTDFIFNGSKGWYLEEDEPDPLNYYGFCKLEYEKLITMSCVKYTIIRTSLIYGSTIEHNNFLSWVKSTMANSEKIDVVYDQYRTPTYVFDLAFIISKIINMKKYGIFHISSGEKLSIFDIVCNIASCYGLNSKMINKIDSNSLNQFAQRPMDTSLQIDKAIKTLKFKPTKLINALTDIS